jgi:DNA modification methylase
MNLSPFLDRIIQGDCLTVLRQLPDECVDMAFADPPLREKLRPFFAIPDDWQRSEAILRRERFTGAFTLPFEPCGCAHDAQAR